MSASQLPLRRYVVFFIKDEEDSVALENMKSRCVAEHISPDCLRLRVTQLPRISNFNDFTPLEMMPGIAVIKPGRGENQLL